jgi:hypothetical protein
VATGRARVFHTLDQSLTIDSVGCTLSLAEVYDRINFPEEPEESEETGDGRA